MIVVWKYELIGENPLEQQAIEMPAEAEILRVGLDQHMKACVWARVNTENPSEYRRFVVYPTGVENEYDHGKYVGSIEKGTKHGWFIYHVFDVT